VEVVASLSQGRTAAAQCGLFTHKSVPVIFEPPCSWLQNNISSIPVTYYIIPLTVCRLHSAMTWTVCRYSKYSYLMKQNKFSGMDLNGTGKMKDEFIFIQFLKNYVTFSHHHLWYPS